jgi:hypothetical protein
MSGTAQQGTPAPADAGSSLQKAAASIEQILDRENGNPEAPRQAPVPRRAPSRTEADASSPDAETEPRETLSDAETDGEVDDLYEQPDAEEDGSEEATEAEEQETDDEPVPRSFTVKIDGKDVKVTEPELVNGYLRQQDYTRKTMALAENDKQFRGYVAAVQSHEQELRTERAQYAELLPVLSEQLAALKGQIGEPDPQLLNTDPVEYMRQRAVFDDIQKREMAAAQEMQRLQHVSLEEQQKQRAALLIKERELVKQRVPAWADDARWKQVTQTARAYAEELGYTEAEIREVLDHRAVMVLWQAARYASMAKQGIPVANRPRQQTATPPDPGPAPTRRRLSVHNQNKQRLAKSHSVADAASVIRGLL